MAIDSLLEGYEYISYDSRMRSRTADVEQMSIEDVVLVLSLVMQKIMFLLLENKKLESQETCTG